MSWRIVSCLLLLQYTSWSQTTITGIVTDMESGQLVPSAHVFINSTTIGTVSGENGGFMLRNVPSEQCQFIVSVLGYDNYVLSLPSNRTDLRLQVRLKAKQETLETLTISATQDKEWQRNLKAFKREFLGKTTHAASCQIVNPWVLEFSKKGAVFRAETSQPLQIINNALGYEVTFHLNRFEYTGVGYSIVGPVRFRELNNPAQFDAGRLSSFVGSSKHFFKLLLKNQHNERGFRIYRSLNALEEQQRTSRFRETLPGLAEVSAAEVVTRDSTGGLAVHSTRPLEVHYEPARDFEPVYQDVLHQVSWIQSRTGIIQLDSAGNILNQEDVTVSGYWNRLRVADLLPSDYQPGRNLNSDASPEELAVITDRSIFDKGSQVWYTVLSTGKSKSAYVQLLDSLGNIISSRIDPFGNRLAAGQFQLPALEGKYYLRATTPSSFSNSKYQVKPLLVTNKVLDCDDRRLGASMAMRPDSIDEKAILNLSLLDKSQETLRGEFSLAIAPTGTDCDCLDGRSIKFEKKPDQAVPRETIDRGYVTDSRGKPVGSRLVLFTRDLSFSIERSISEDGSFLVDDIDFYDSTSWLAQVYDKQDRDVEGFNITADSLVTPIASSFTPWNISCQWPEPVIIEPSPDVRPLASPRRTSDELKLSDSTRLLSEITVRGKRIRQNPKPQTVFRAYGIPQYVVKGNDLINNPAGTNVLNTLAGRVPGVRVFEGNNNWGGGKTNISIRNSRFPPLIMIDGFPFTDINQAYDVLQSIPLTDIDRVEVRTALSPLAGLNGANGVIAVYTKRSAVPQEERQRTASVKKIEIGGYSTPPRFLQDTTANPTYYWNPRVPFEPAPVRIDTSGLPDQIEVMVSGIDVEGKMILVRKKVTISDTGGKN